MSIEHRPVRHPALALAALLASLSPTGAWAEEASNDLSYPKVEACSERYRQVATPRPDPSAEDARQGVRQGFATTRSWGVDTNVELLDAEATGLGESGLRVHYPAGTSSPGDTQQGGAGFYSAPAGVAGAERACLTYRVRFEPGFDFVKGGKLPGLFGGEAPSGGEEVNGETGFSMRFMWRQAGQGELYEYVASKDEEYGASVGRGLWSFPTGEWVTVEQELVLNTPGEENGLARVWINGVPVLEQGNIVYRTTNEVTIDGLMFSTFFGGHGKEWRTPRDQHADFAAFRFYVPAS
ncbi:polysaccharide lyase [Halomonas sp. 1390]|uniref:polysaccharide lyase n=1 Tax=Halomonas sp. B23F22_3 TaxID=3459516 RepID=UPI00373F73DA